MTPLQILTAALEGRPAPRIPVFCNLIDQGARELGLPQREYYARGENVAEGQLRLLARYGHDNVWSLFYVGAEAEILGCREVLFADDGSPNVADLVLKNWDDVARLEIPRDITAHPSWERTAACLRILRAEVGASHPICAYITASTTLPAILMGMEKWLELLLTGPADVRDELLRKCSDFCRQELAAYWAGGANVLVYSTPFGTTEFVGARRFRELSLPWMRRDLEPGATAGVVYYCGMAPFNNVIEAVREHLGLRAFYVSPLADLAEAKALLGDRALTCGVVNDIEMIHWTPEETRAEVERLCAIGKPGGHFLLGTGLMPLAVPEANIRALIAAAHEHGRYP